jgi:hypothetical protein
MSKLLALFLIASAVGLSASTTQAIPLVSNRTQANLIVPVGGRRDMHAPVFVSGPRGHSVVTPYYFGYYPNHYSYNSPGPVFYRLDYPGPHNSCWLWRYNYLIWIC